MELDEPTSNLKIIAPDSTSGQGDELEGMFLPIGGDDILIGMSKFVDPIAMEDHSPPDSQEVDMDIEDLEALHEPKQDFPDQGQD